MTHSNNLAIKALLLASSISLAACGGGGGGDDDDGGGGGGGTGGGGGSTNTKPVANAGPAVDITKTFTVNLDGSGSSDADSDTLTFTWTQTRGADVTSGAGSLSGENPAFPAPDGVDTLVFDLVVNDGTEDSDASTVVVNVFEDINVTYFVDGDSGDDTTGTGSRDNPFATLAKAVIELTSNLEDIYVKTLDAGAVYDATAANLDIPSGTSLYGGYDANWMRNVVLNKTLVNTNHRGVQFFSVTQDAWFSGFDVMSSDSTDATEDVYGVSASGDGSATFYMHDNIVVNGDVEAGEDSTPGTNYGVSLKFLALAEVRGNQILAGTGGDGINGNTGSPGDDGDDGNKGNLTSGFKANGGSGGRGGDGGKGGTRGGGFIFGNGGGGEGGKGGSAPLGGTISAGSGGAGGSGNVADGGSRGTVGATGGKGTPGAAGNGAGNLNSTIFNPSHGIGGGRGGHGAGGGGGGGGEANINGVVGGGGGGGGEGGEGGFGGSGGRGAGASIGIWLHAVTSSELTGNTITSAMGGLGNRGGFGGSGGTFGAGGDGSPGHDLGTCFFCAGIGGGGADGRRGGSGGSGGYGGAGGGGPSYGIIFAGDMEPTITGNTITSGDGGDGGNGGFRGNGGQGGFSYAIYDRDTTDAFFATLNQNLLASGTAGTGGTSSGQDTATAGSDGGSGTTNWM